MADLMTNTAHWARTGLLRSYSLLYEGLACPLLFRQDAQTAHEQALRLLRWADERTWVQAVFAGLRRATLPPSGRHVGGVTLDSPMILAAGFVKGAGFTDEAAALAAVQRGENIMPGWRSMPALVGAVEFGSFTRYPRLGNAGTVLWRDVASRSTQNRVGLKNPGALAAAAFLAARLAQLPACYGINIAVSPGVSDSEQEQREVVEALELFLAAGVRPAWFTLNLSCPNTEDDPGGNQTEHKTRLLCAAAVSILAQAGIPLWVKVGPDLAPSQYAILMRVFAETGVRAVIATNTLGQPTPDGRQTAGVGGGWLHAPALHAVEHLQVANPGGQVAVIGCGGVQDGLTYAEFTRRGAHAVQYWSALVYRGPLAAALVFNETANDQKGIGP